MSISDSINIAYCCDQNYVQYLVPSIISIIDSRKKGTNISIFILETGINNYHKDNILKLQTSDVNIEFINVEQQAKDLILSKVSHKISFNSSILYKLLIPQILKHKDEVLLLDADTIVQGDLSVLFNQNMDSYYISASKTKLPYPLKYLFHNNKKYTINDFYKNILQLPEHYCNNEAEYYLSAGVVLFNNKKILLDRKEEELILKFFKYKEGLVYAEQDILLKVFLENIKSLSYKYNQIHISYFYINKENYKEIISNLEDSVIVHYHGSKSYAKLMRSVYAKVYFEKLQKSYLSLSPLKVFLLKLEILRKCSYRPKAWWSIPYILKNI